MTAIMDPKAKGRPGPDSKQRDIGYGEDLEKSKVDEAQKEAQTNPYYASSESSRATRPPPLDPAAGDLRMKQLAAEHVPGYDLEPMVASISPSDAG